MRHIDRTTKRLFKEFQAKMGTVMRARLASERQIRRRKIQTIKATINAIDGALEKPGSKRALRGLSLAKRQMAKLLTEEVSDLAERLADSKRTLAALSTPRSSS